MHGFRPNRGTESALLELLEKIKLLKCQGQKVAVLALDASAAFDILSHTLILRSLEAIGAALQRQYERWQPRARYKQSLDPTVDDVKKLCTSLRRNAKVNAQSMKQYIYTCIIITSISIT